MSSEIMEFGLDEAKVIKNNAIDFFKQAKSGEKTRVSIVSFKKFSDVVFAAKAKEKDAPLTDQEKAELLVKIDTNLAGQLGKKVEELTEVDRLDIKQPRFAFKYTHYRDGIGGICCHSEYQGGNVVKPELCCRKLGDAEQTVGCIIMTYPVGEGMQVDEDLLAQKKYVNFYMWRMSAKKFKRITDAYAEARGEDKFTPDFIVTLDGDPKYQKQNINAGSSAVWARGAINSPTRLWVLDQGLRLWKHVPNGLGFDMKMDKLAEKLGQPAIGGGDTSESPRLVSGYDNLITLS